MKTHMLIRDWWKENRTTYCGVPSEDTDASRYKDVTCKRCKKLIKKKNTNKGEIR